MDLSSLSFLDIKSILENNPNADFDKLVIENENLSTSEKEELQDFFILKEESSEVVKEDDSDSKFPNYDNPNLYKEINIPKKSWRELNPNNLSYWHWLKEIGIKYFWGSQPEIETQSTLLAVCCALNSAAMPPNNSALGKDVQLPLLNFNGESRSGKTEGSKFLWLSYEDSAKALFPASSSPKSLRNALHNLAWRNFKYQPCVVTIDNFSRNELKKYESQGMRMLFLGVCKNQSTLTNASREGDSDVKEFRCHALKAFTTIESISAFTQEEEELKLRMVYFFTERINDWNSFAGWDFSDIPLLYQKLWSKENYIKFVEKYLFPVVALSIKEFPYPQEYQAQTHLIIATGLFIGIWSSLKEALDFFGQYWEYVLEKSKENPNLLEQIIDELLADHISGKVKQFELTTIDRWNREQIKNGRIIAHGFVEQIKQKKLIKTISNKDEEFIRYYMAQQNWKLDTSEDISYFVYVNPKKKRY